MIKVSSVNFLSLLLPFDFETYMPLILNMKKEVKHLLFKLGHDFALWQCFATCCQDDTAEAPWLCYYMPSS